ncbi:hypothetical protein BN59_00644 [Legionella massiliensis]|uniref:Uncharacterized protein n=1 Tax=Legionella massiliensis TaxID=1034943 RepID=A0A078KPP6_9GAMM|nr:hypothetical protein [Legionella massiliensis]CDZ76375.1 hypothetical protein BN59_00644 [Legionella massiliensis]CEE12113.1 hypothetical protein BN1094_00644 [Legionella massiliensis]
MRKIECSKTGSCIWTLRFEILGIFLLVIATYLTISTGKALAIVALFAVGVILCLFTKLCDFIYPSKHLSCPTCATQHSSSVTLIKEKDEDEEGKNAMDNEGGNPIHKE